MSIELVYRMRTCAAAMLCEAGPGVTKMQWQEIYRDAADLLIEASNLLNEKEPLGEPMEMIHPAVLTDLTGCSGVAVWGDNLPAIKARPCPSCGSVDARTVRRNGRHLMLTCPTCTHEWEYGK
jgi:hypothetical protein